MSTILMMSVNVDDIKDIRRGISDLKKILRYREEEIKNKYGYTEIHPNWEWNKINENPVRRWSV